MPKILHQPDIGIQTDNFIPENIPLIPSTSAEAPPQQLAKSEFSVPTPFIFHAITERQKRAFFTDGISFSEKFINNSTNFLPFEKHCNDIHSIPRIRENHDSHLEYIY